MTGCHNVTLHLFDLTCQYLILQSPRSSTMRIFALFTTIASLLGSTFAFVLNRPIHHSSIASSATALSATLEAILFDCDGVLADTERDGHRPAFNRAFKENGIDDEWSVDHYGELLEIAGGKERMTGHWNEMGWPDSLPTSDEERKAKIKGLHLQKTDIFMEMINEGAIPLRPGVLRLIDEAIENGVRLACCSTSNDKAVSNLIKTLMGPERAAKFSIFAGDMVKKKKPAPDVYNMAVDEMQLDKSRCVIVEDTSIGLGAAKAAGIKCIVTKSAYADKEDFTGANAIVDDLDLGDVTLGTLASLLD